MTSVSPYQRAETAIRDLLRRGTSEERERRSGGGAESVTSVLMRLGLEALLNRALEEERTDFLGRERYERAPAEQSERSGYRNGYKPGHVDTAEGRVPLAVP
jgi:transposase-like protein